MSPWSPQFAMSPWSPQSNLGRLLCGGNLQCPPAPTPWSPNVPLVPPGSPAT